MSSFIQKCLSSEANPEDIDDFIDQWHENPGNQTLYEFLGMTRNDYARWIADSSVLPAIINSHKCLESSAPSASPAAPAA